MNKFNNCLIIAEKAGSTFLLFTVGVPHELIHFLVSWLLWLPATMSAKYTWVYYKTESLPRARMIIIGIAPLVVGLIVFPILLYVLLFMLMMSFPMSILSFYVTEIIVLIFFVWVISCKNDVLGVLALTFFYEDCLEKRSLVSET